MTRSIVAVGPLPPPVHGASLVTARLVASFEDGFDVRCFDIGRPSGNRWRALHRRLWAAACAAWRALSPSCELVYLSMPDGPAVWLLLPTTIAARAVRRRVVMHHHSFAYLDRTRWDHRVVLRTSPRAEHIVLCRRMEHLLHARYGGSGEFHVISNEAFVDPARPRDGLVTQERAGAGLVVAHLANLSIEKGLDIVLDTMRHAFRTNTDIDLRLGGVPVDEPARLALAAGQHDLADRLDYWGPVRQDQLDDFYRGVSVFLFPSRYQAEAQPLTVLEALARGVPCVTSEVGCLAATSGLTTTSDLTSAGLVDLLRRVARTPRDTVGIDASDAREVLTAQLPVSLGKLHRAMRE